jgi:hypothetical protein
VLVHTWLLHSVDELLTTVHAAPNVPAAGPLSGDGFASLLQPASAMATSQRVIRARIMTILSSHSALADFTQQIIHVDIDYLVRRLCWHLVVGDLNVERSL